ncbi:hypothetical protein DFO77_103131 [Marinilabilia salmonicolor]|uniref:Phage protein n=1 Tax=Marinilabilia salmonicolor TaxID=989 RepID=A0A368VI31_9BACT|nr:hypothetical protein DFO77_103131 [Marinilabilia salmonicolor]
MCKSGVSPDYFLDSMTLQELDLFVESYTEDFKQEQERLRLLGWWIISVNSTKKVKLTDVIKFSWDNEKEPDNNLMTEDRFNELKDKYKNALNKR